ncbi:MvaI/BcnI family restriction endonuclease [Microbulbifer agarilyticus]|uniref:MvaI/BcnI family restriction endonuclease n=1 Tax=Microbulbifer agarilyticus TaxID=260552 RepID=UPI001CD346CA|nr:MvaI/BcnI family restriction endonuclease [Microbulbifer agarilyticus]
MIHIEPNDENRLLDALASLCRKGPVEPVGTGPNAIGKTLQEMLDIKHSTSNRNTLHNFVITATKSRPQSGGRTNLFACVADWKNSRCKSSKELAERYGREDASRGYAHSLFCTSSATGPNGFGLKLNVNPEDQALEEWHTSDEGETPVVRWCATRLINKLAALGKSAIVTALPVTMKSGRNFYHYRYVDILGQPDSSSFFELLSHGIITIDHCISIPAKGGPAREQGPLFKIRADARSELYGSLRRIDLLDL